MRRCEVCFAPLPSWEEAYLWPCVRGGLTVCADCFDTLVGGLSRRELAARLRTFRHVDLAQIAGVIDEGETCTPELIKTVFDVDVQMSINPQTGKPFFMPFRARQAAAQ